MANNSLRILPVVILACSIFVLSGCSSLLGGTPASRSGGCYQQNFNNLLEQTDLKKVFADIARELCVDACSNCGQQSGAVCTQNDLSASSAEIAGRTVLVTDFVDIQSFLPKQQGILMGELMRGSLNSSCCYRIVQVEFAKYFKLSESGLIVLSRNANVVKNDDYSQSECIVGTYSIMNNKLLIFVKKINTVTGKISKMVTREINYTCSGNNVSYTIN
jgi:hypothetical protein